MEPQPDLTEVSQRQLEDMIRARRNLSAAMTVAGVLGLFALVYLLVPVEQRPAHPVTAERFLTR